MMDWDETVVRVPPYDVSIPAPVLPAEAGRTGAGGHRYRVPCTRRVFQRCEA